MVLGPNKQISPTGAGNASCSGWLSRAEPNLPHLLSNNKVGGTQPKELSTCNQQAAPVELKSSILIERKEAREIRLNIL
jgi:hypothetical protein